MSAYLTAVLADNPIHYWRLADPGGQIGHDIGSTVWQLLNQTSGLGYSGPVSDGGAFYMNGLYAGLASGDTIQSQTSPFSTELWFWPVFTPAANWWVLTWGGSTPYVEVVWSTTQALSSFVNGVGPTSVGTYPSQAWHHAVMTYDGTTVRQYVDGVAAGTALVAGPVTVHRIFQIGSLPGSSTNWFEGFFSEVAIYSTALSAGRVAAHYAAADQVSQAPVFGAAGGLSGGGPGSPSYTSILNQILASVRKVY